MVKEKRRNMRKATIKFFNDSKGYGFATLDAPDPTGFHELREIFVHYSVIDTPGFKTLQDGQPIELDFIDGPKGLQATRVVKVG